MTDRERQFLIRFCRHIDKLCRERGIDQKALAALIDCDEKTIYRMKKAENAPAITIVIRISDALGIDHSELMNFYMD